MYFIHKVRFMHERYVLHTSHVTKMYELFLLCNRYLSMGLLASFHASFHALPQKNERSTRGSLGKRLAIDLLLSGGQPRSRSVADLRRNHKSFASSSGPEIGLD